MQRIPPSALWGYISYSNSDEQALAEALYADLEGLTTITPLPEGYYGHFTLANEAEVTAITGQEDGIDYRSFVLESSLSESEIEMWLGRFEAQAPDGMQLRLMSGSGQEWAR